MALFGVASFSMLTLTDNPNIQSAGTFIRAFGTYPCIPNTIVWASNNLEAVYARGVALGFIIGWGNLNGIVASSITKSEETPCFIIGHAVCITYKGLFFVGGSLVQHLRLRWENRRRLQGKLDHLVKGKTEEEIDLLGDKKPDFIHIL